MRKKGDSLKDYYAVLGIGSDASAIEIRDSFRQMAKRFHPDVAPAGQDFSEKFREINEAYDVLGSSENRLEYDRDRAASQDPRWVNFDEVSSEEAEAEAEAEATEPVEPERVRRRRKRRNEWFEEDDEGEWDEQPERAGLFDKVFGYNKANTRSEERRGGPDVRYGDLETELLVTLGEVLHGATRVINLRRKGSSEQPRQLTVNVPRGIGSGHVIRMKGKGRTSLSRGTTGDLFVTVRYAPQQQFTVRGYDLLHTLHLRPWQFVLGDVITVPTIDGGLKAKVPPGSRPGQSLKIRNQGLPKDDENRGDLVVNLKIDFPQAVDPEARRAWEAVKQTDRRD